MPLSPLMILVIVVGVIHASMLGIIAANLWYLRRGRATKQHTFSQLPSVSILIPARNEEANLQRLLPSILAQTYPDFEVVVYDDGSEDNTWDVIQSYTSDPRLRSLQGNGPPPGWVGKVHALYQATRKATGDRYLFLDADAELTDPDALHRLVAQHEAMPPSSVMTGLPRLDGGGKLLVSLVPNAILSGIPWPLVRRFKMGALGALNGQCWMIQSRIYHLHEPHEALPDEVLEDVMIGRYLKRRNVIPTLRDVQDEVTVYMYTGTREAWNGFRKNAYLILGGTPLAFAGLFSYYVLVLVAAPFLWPGYLVSLYLIKGGCDRIGRFSWGIVLLAPLALLLGSVLQLHSALDHWRGKVSWKGRTV